MVQMRVMTKRDGLDRTLREFGPAIDDMKRTVLQSMARTIADNSPVDSGTYVRSHRVALRSGSFKPNKERPDGIPRRTKGDPVDAAAARAAGLSSMMGQIESINIKSSNFVFRNPMLYARLVEGKHAVYARARREAAAIIQDALSRIKF